MNECPRADMRDMLPDFVHGTLDAADAAAVSSHIAVCPECAAEVELLQGMRSALAAGTPRVNTSEIAAAVVRRTRPAPSAGGRRWVGAAILTLAASVALAALMIRDGRSAPDAGATSSVASSAVSGYNDSAVARNGENNERIAVPVDSQLAPNSEPRTPAPQLVGTDAPVIKLASALPVGGALRDLNEVELERLLTQIDEMEALTPISPEPVMVTSVEVPQ